MNTLASILPALALVANGATVTSKGNRLRLTRAEFRMSHLPADVLAALDAMTAADCTVRVFSRGKVHTLLAPATAATRKSRKVRSKVMVEVAFPA